MAFSLSFFRKIHGKDTIEIREKMTRRKQSSYPTPILVRISTLLMK